MPNTYRGFTILEEYPNESNLSSFTAFVWQKNEYFKSEIYDGDCQGGCVGFGRTEYEAVKSAVDEYWEDIDLELNY